MLVGASIRWLTNAYRLGPLLGEGRVEAFDLPVGLKSAEALDIVDLVLAHFRRGRIARPNNVADSVDEYCDLSRVSEGTRITTRNATRGAEHAVRSIRSAIPML